jgi:hypothetical protein
MPSYKPKMSKGKIVETEANPLLSNNNTIETVEHKTVGWGAIIYSWFNSLILYVLLSVFLLISIYAGLSATVLYNVSKEDQSFFVIRGTYVGGIIPEGETVYASPDKNLDNTVISKLLEGFVGIENGIVVKTLAGPTGQIYVDPTTQQVMTVDNNNTIIKKFDGKFVGETPADLKLKEQYLVECVYTDNCEQGTIFIINSKQISGEVATELKLTDDIEIKAVGYE